MLDRQESSRAQNPIAESEGHPQSPSFACFALNPQQHPFSADSAVLVVKSDPWQGLLSRGQEGRRHDRRSTVAGDALEVNQSGSLGMPIVDLRRTGSVYRHLYTASEVELSGRAGLRISMYDALRSGIGMSWYLRLSMYLCLHLQNQG